MKEHDLENILMEYPELIEEGLTFKDRQVYLEGKYLDLLFKDRYGQALIIELKRGTVKREDIAQLMEYEGFILEIGDPTIRAMLVGRRVPKNFQRALDHHGLEWKEIRFKTLRKFLEKENREKYLELFGSDVGGKQDNKQQKETDKASEIKQPTERLEKKEKAFFSKINIFKALKREKPKKSEYMGRRTGTDLLGTRAGTMAYKFCLALTNSGKDGLTMAEARKAPWNPKHYSFKETVSRLIKEGLVFSNGKRYHLTEEGIREAKKELLN